MPGNPARHQNNVGDVCTSRLARRAEDWLASVASSLRTSDGVQEDICEAGPFLARHRGRFLGSPRCTAHVTARRAVRRRHEQLTVSARRRWTTVRGGIRLPCTGRTRTSLRARRMLLRARNAENRARHQQNRHDVRSQRLVQCAADVLASAAGSSSLQGFRRRAGVHPRAETVRRRARHGRASATRSARCAAPSLVCSSDPI